MCSQLRLERLPLPLVTMAKALERKRNFSVCWLLVHDVRLLTPETVSPRLGQIWGERRQPGLVLLQVCVQPVCRQTEQPGISGHFARQWSAGCRSRPVLVSPSSLTHRTPSLLDQIRCLLSQSKRKHLSVCWIPGTFTGSWRLSGPRCRSEPALASRWPTESSISMGKTNSNALWMVCAGSIC